MDKRTSVYQVIGVSEAGDLVGRAPGSIKSMCQRGVFGDYARRVGTVWIIDRDYLVRYYETLDYNNKK